MDPSSEMYCLALGLLRQVHHYNTANFVVFKNL